MEPNFENVRSIFPLNKSKIFTLDEAEELVPLLNLISQKTKRELNLLNSQLSFVRTNSDRSVELQAKLNEELQSWSDKIRRLGAIPISLCKVRIPGKDATYVWEYPETKLYIH